MSDVGTRTMQWIIDRTKEDENGCWIWQLKKTKDGYGQTTIDVLRDDDLGNYQNKASHCLAYRLHYGKWAKPVCRHMCHNKACCNPTHLQEGTYSDNSLDTAKNKYTVLRDRELLIVIYTRYYLEGVSDRDISAELGISRTTVKRMLAFINKYS